jgi:2-keto-4-pentenoate hydratase/2-oxohepta-3-ene-1,7-dioic acid hydratase in catechol pathway
MLGDVIGEGADGKEPRILAPVEPSKIVCVGLNYRQHAAEMNKNIPPEPLLFMKPPTAIIGPGEPIELPAQAQMVHHEGELAVVVGKRAKNIDPEESQRVIVGYTCANDVTARDIQRREKRYTRGKGFDTFCPLGPALALADEFVAAEHLLTCSVDGVERQRSRLNDFIFSIDHVVAFISRIMTLMPGDVVLTGTPAGVGQLRAGEVVSVEIDGIGRLENPVVKG